jgi:hypothetical protein
MDNTPLLRDFDADARTCAPDFPWWSLTTAADTANLGAFAPLEWFRMEAEA